MGVGAVDIGWACAIPATPISAIVSIAIRFIIASSIDSSPNWTTLNIWDRILATPGQQPGIFVPLAIQKFNVAAIRLGRRSGRKKSHQRDGAEALSLRSLCAQASPSRCFIQRNIADLHRPDVAMLRERPGY
jgi:hypothetical protein